MMMPIPFATGESNYLLNDANTFCSGRLGLSLKCGKILQLFSQLENLCTSDCQILQTSRDGTREFLTFEPVKPTDIELGDVNRLLLKE